jgi:hypothetical protein
LTVFEFVAVRCVVEGGWGGGGRGAVTERRGKSFPPTSTLFGEASLENEIIKRKLKEENKLLKKKINERGEGF